MDGCDTLVVEETHLLWHNVDEIVVGIQGVHFLTFLGSRLNLCEILKKPIHAGLFDAKLASAV